MINTRVSVPSKAVKGDVVELKALIRHPMESGHRRDARGEAIPRNIIVKFECEYNNNTILSVDVHPGVSANPLITFFTVAWKSGEVKFKWTDQHGQVWTDQASIAVS